MCSLKLLNLECTIKVTLSCRPEMEVSSLILHSVFIGLFNLYHAYIYMYIGKILQEIKSSLLFPFSTAYLPILAFSSYTYMYVV